MGNDAEAAAAPANMTSYLAYVQSNNANVRLICSTIYPNTNATINARIVTFNAALQSTIWPAAQGLGQSIYTIDGYSAINPATDLAVDGEHLNENGCIIMAALIWDAMKYVAGYA
jgi:hypothetical protein